MRSGDDEADHLARWARKAADFVALTAVVLGAVVRLRQWAAGRSLWLDEAMLADNVIRRGFAGLARPLDFDQAAPLGFLWASKLVTLVFGTGERALRLLPLSAGLAALPMLWLLARRATGSRWAAALAVALLAASLEAVTYSAEFKQYGLDLLAAVVVPWLALRLLDGPAETAARRWATLLPAGLAFVFVSHAAAFVVGGTGLTVLAVFALRRRWKTVAVAAGVAAAWLALFGLLWLLVYRRGAANGTLVGYWYHAFLPIPPRSGDDAAKLLAAGYSLLEEAFSGPPKILGNRFAAVLIVGGVAGFVVMLVRRRGAALAMLWLPVLLAAGASALKRYPFEERLILFTAAATLVTAAAGFGEVVSALLASRARESRAAGWATAAGLLALPLVCLLLLAARTLERQEMRPLLEKIKPLMRDDDFVYRHAFAEPAWRYYAPKIGLADHPGAAGERFLDRGTWAGLGREADSASGAPRVWVLTANADLWDGEPDLSRLFAELERRGGRVVYDVTATGVEARLYEFPAAGDGSAGVSP